MSGFWKCLRKNSLMQRELVKLLNLGGIKFMTIKDTDNKTVAS